MSDHDETLVNELRAAMHAEVAGVTASPSLLAGVRKRHARRVATRRLGLAIPAVAAAAAITMPLVVAGGSGAPAPPQAINAAYVMQQTSKAVDGRSHYIMYEKAIETFKDKHGKQTTETDEVWFRMDGSADRMVVSVDGKLLYDRSATAKRSVDVFYDRHVWRDLGPNQNGFTHTERPEALTPAQIHKYLASGELKLVGPGDPVDGRPTLALHRDGFVYPPIKDNKDNAINDPRAIEEGPAMTIYVDKQTYLPVRYHVDNAQTSVDIEWLAPTKANVALLETKIPHGFKQAYFL